jgi:hypothetical protein
MLKMQSDLCVRGQDLAIWMGRASRLCGIVDSVF